MKKIIICVLSILFINTAFGSPEDGFTAEELKINKMVDRVLEIVNKEYPKMVSHNLITNRAYRKGKNIYYTYTNIAETKDSAYFDNVRKKEKDIMLSLCSTDVNKTLFFPYGYSVIVVYNLLNKEIVHRIVADKDTCAKYW